MLNSLIFNPHMGINQNLLKSKTAVITGSTKGIGKAIGLSLLNEGCFVVFNYSNSIADAKCLEIEIKERYAGQYAIIKATLSTHSEVLRFAADVLKLRNSLDYVFLNAGTTSRKSLNEISIEEWNSVLNTNLSMPLFLIQALSDHINENGRIIFTGSLMALYPHSMSIAYGVSKAAIHTLAKYLVKEFADRKITVNVIVPGFVDTPWQINKPAEIRKSIEGKVALGRFADPDEIAELCLEVVKNGYINGSELVIDGGYCYK